MSTAAGVRGSAEAEGWDHHAAHRQHAAGADGEGGSDAGVSATDGAKPETPDSVSTGIRRAVSVSAWFFYIDKNTEPHYNDYLEQPVTTNNL